MYATASLRSGRNDNVGSVPVPGQTSCISAQLHQALTVGTTYGIAISDCVMQVMFNSEATQCAAQSKLSPDMVPRLNCFSRFYKVKQQLK